MFNQWRLSIAIDNMDAGQRNVFIFNSVRARTSRIYGKHWRSGHLNFFKSYSRKIEFYVVKEKNWEFWLEWKMATLSASWKHVTRPWHKSSTQIFDFFICFVISLGILMLISLRLAYANVIADGAMFKWHWDTDTHWDRTDIKRWSKHKQNR